MTKEIKELHNKIDGIIAVMATKDDLKNFLTKEDGKTFATKDDLKGFATKDDISRLAGAIQKMDAKFDRRIDDLTEFFKDRFNTILHNFDHFQKKVREFDLEEAAQSHQLRTARQTLADHERRLTSLESKR